MHDNFRDTGDKLMKRTLLTILLLSLSCVSYAHGAQHKSTGKQGETIRSDHLPKAPNHELPIFSLTDQNGASITRETVKGKISIIDFIYSSCGDECPLMTTRMKALQTKLSDTSGVFFVTITTDPTHDTPAVLKSYAQNFKANEANWLFLTGDKRVIVDLSVRGFNLPAAENSPDHTELFALVDTRGWIQGYYDSTKAKQLEQLERDVRLLAKKLSK